MRGGMRGVVALRQSERNARGGRAASERNARGGRAAGMRGVVALRQRYHERSHLSAACTARPDAVIACPRMGPANTSPGSADRNCPVRVVWGVAQMAVHPADHLLEIGCGAGYAVALIAPTLMTGTITAIDRSPLQVQKAEQRNAAHVAAGRARFAHCSLAQAPTALVGRFSKVFAINVNAFWTEPKANFDSLRMLLRPQGLAYLIQEPPTAAALSKQQRTLPELARAHGFHVHSVRTDSPQAQRFLCVLQAAPVDDAPAPTVTK